jgi:hypothetical protein
MRIAATIGAAMVVVISLAASAQVRAEDRSQLIACQALIERTAQAAKDADTAAKKDDPALVRCR